MHRWMSARSSIPGDSGSPAGPASLDGGSGGVTAGPGRGPPAPYPTGGRAAGKAPPFTGGAARVAPRRPARARGPGGGPRPAGSPPAPNPGTGPPPPPPPTP